MFIVKPERKCAGDLGSAPAPGAVSRALAGNSEERARPGRCFPRPRGKLRSVICNRPDDEQPGQPAHDAIKAAVEAAGLAFRYIPVVSGQITGGNVEDQAQALDDLEGPVFAYCRSGARCTNLYALVQDMKRG